jgi:hypothetical protein
MPSITRFTKGLVALLLTAGAGLGLGACGNYAVYKVHVSATTPRDDIQQCTMTIADENGKCAVSNLVLAQVAGQPGQPLAQGCAGGLTPANVGTFSYSTSRSGGFLTFTVNALDANGNVVETKTSDPQGVVAYPPEVAVELAMSRTGSPQPPPTLCCNPGTGAGC